MKLSTLLLVASLPAILSAAPIDIGNRLELFADDYLIGKMSPGISRHVHQPVAKDVVFSADAPWEGNTSGYYTVFRDGDRIRMIYRGWAHEPTKRVRQRHPEVTCLAESRDGLYFTKPNLGLWEWNGSKQNNIILMGAATHNFAAFKDLNPKAPPEARYKGIGGEKRAGGLFVFHSPDGIHWKKISEKPVITDGAFDSQNLAFWDAHAGIYRAYYRIFSQGGTDGGQWRPKGFRAIRTAVSDDFINWKPGVDLTYPEDTPEQHLYTNAIQPYERAPHLLIGFPTRYLPDEGQRVEPIFMVSRNGIHFRRYNEPVIPESAPVDRAGNRSNYMTWGMVSLPDEPGKISVYATEAYYGLEPGRVRRFVYRTDGFVSLRSTTAEGEIITKSLKWNGKNLYLNAAVRKGGSVRAELIGESGKPVPGFSVQDAVPFSGDSIAARVQWKNGKSLDSIWDRSLSVRIVMKNADLFALQFR